MSRAKVEEVLEGTSYLDINNLDPEELVQQLDKLEMLVAYPDSLKSQIVLLRNRLDTIRNEKIDLLKTSNSILGRIKLESKNMATYNKKEREIYTSLAKKRAELDVAVRVASLAKAKIKLVNKLLNESGVSLDGFISN